MYNSEGDYCRGGSFAAGVGQPPVSVAMGDGMATVMVVLRDRDGVELKRLMLIRASHGCGAFGGGWEWIRMVL